jgi:putative endonuclease
MNRRPRNPRRGDVRPAAPDPTGRSGARGEDLAAAHLRGKGFRVLARNLRTVHGEIDLLVRRRRLYAAVEVKARADHPAPERCVDGERLDRMAGALLGLAPGLRPRPRALRLDVVAVRWLPDASAEVYHFATVRSLEVPVRASGSDCLWRRTEGGGYGWPMAGRAWTRCATAARRLLSWLGRPWRRSHLS